MIVVQAYLVDGGGIFLRIQALCFSQQQRLGGWIDGQALITDFYGRGIMVIPIFKIRIGDAGIFIPRPIVKHL